MQFLVSDCLSDIGSYIKRTASRSCCQSFENAIDFISPEVINAGICFFPLN